MKTKYCLLKMEHAADHGKRNVETIYAVSEFLDVLVTTKI